MRMLMVLAHTKETNPDLDVIFNGALDQSL